MHIGQVIPATSTTTDHFTPWFPSLGNRAVFTFNLIETRGLDLLKVTIQTKNREDSDQDPDVAHDGDEADISLTKDETSIVAGTALGDDSADKGLLELVRVKFQIRASGTTGFAHLRTLQPQWFPH